MSTIFLLFLSFFCLKVLLFAFSVLSTKDDEFVLLEIKKQLHNPDSFHWWVRGFDFCNYLANGAPDYSFITCTSTGHVDSLHLNNLVVITSFPDAICRLTKIKSLELYHNLGFYGPIPSCITKLHNLYSLVITYTSLSGSVPSFYNHPNIIHINLSNNRLSGTIPPSLSTCPKTYLLDLSSNYLTGTIPPGLVHKSSNLILSNNNLTGELPKCYGLLDLLMIDLRNNRLSGDASFLFGKEKTGYYIGLANNDFEFDLSHIEFWNNLYLCDISHNKIYGKVPESFARVLGLYDVNLSFNRLCGELPQGGNMCRFNAAVFANNTCLGNLPLPCSISAFAPGPRPVSEPPLALEPGPGPEPEPVSEPSLAHGHKSISEPPSSFNT